MTNRKKYAILKPRTEKDHNYPVQRVRRLPERRCGKDRAAQKNNYPVCAACGRDCGGTAGIRHKNNYPVCACGGALGQKELERKQEPPERSVRQKKVFTCVTEHRSERRHACVERGGLTPSRPMPFDLSASPAYAGVRRFAEPQKSALFARERTERKKLPPFRRPDNAKGSLPQKQSENATFIRQKAGSPALRQRRGSVFAGYSVPPQKSGNHIFSGTPMPSRARALVSVCSVAWVSARRKFLSCSVSAARILQLK